jgi:flagellar hook-associated protein 2
MVTAINLGNIFSSGGKYVSGGSATGLDTEKLIEDLVKARRTPAVLLEDRLELNSKRSTAMTEFKTLLNDMRTATDFLRSPPGFQNADEDIFKYRSPKLTTNTGAAASNYLSATAGPGASLSDYQITVNQVATFNNKTTNTFAAANTNLASIVGGGGPFQAGTYQIGASGQTVTLNAGDSIDTVVSKFNAVSSNSKVQASFLQVSPGNYRIIFKSTETGTANNYDFDAANPGMLTVGFALQQDAVDASLTIDGTTVTRSSNNITDVITNVTLNLQGVTPPGTVITAEIEPDGEFVKDGIMNFIDAYNNMVIFASKQNQRDSDGSPLEDSVLANNSSLSFAINRVLSQMSTIVSGLTTNPNRLSDLGITFSDYQGDDETPFTRNILQVDEDKLEAAIAGNFEGVRKVFAFDMVSDNSNLAVYTRTNALNVTAFSLAVDTGAVSASATYNDGGSPATVALDIVAQGGGSFLITGQDGTPFEGLSLIYGGTTGTMNVTLSQGVGDRVFNELEDILDDQTGIIPLEINAYAENKVNLQEEIDKIDEAIELYRQSLVEKYANLEQTITSINRLLQSLTANDDARNNN